MWFSPTICPLLLSYIRELNPLHVVVRHPILRYWDGMRNREAPSSKRIPVAMFCSFSSFARIDWHLIEQNVFEITNYIPVNAANFVLFDANLRDHLEVATLLNQE